jgi:hypothetical protein
MKAAESNNLLETGEFAPATWNQPINRQEMAKIMMRAMEYVQKEELIADTASFTTKITDFAGINISYQPYIAQAYAKGIVSGYPDGSFGGGKQATRAEACTMVMRLLNPYYRLGSMLPAVNLDKPYSWTEIIGAVNGENIYRFEYDYYFNYYFNSYFNEYYESMLYYQGVDMLDEQSARELLGDLEDYAWNSVVQASLIRQMAKEYKISLDPSYYEALLLPYTVLAINTNRLFSLIYPFIEEEAKAGSGVGEAEAKEYYQTDPSGWDCGKVAHIILTAQQMHDEAQKSGKKLTGAEAEKAAEKQAKDIIAQLTKGEDFAKLAAQYSADGTAEIGGELDLYFNIYGDGVDDEYAGFDSDFAAGAFLLKNVGDFSKEPVESSFGYHIIKLLDKKEGFEAVKGYILNNLKHVGDHDVEEYFSNKLKQLEESAVIERKFDFKYYR